jgi:hypothetical protein
MIFLESLEELDILKVSGLLEICKVNRDYISGYGQYSKADFYRIFADLLDKKIKIKIPDLDEKYYKTVHPYYPFSTKLKKFLIVNN